VRVDQDVANGRVLEERFNRPQTRELVHDLVDEVAQFPEVERYPLGEHVGGNQTVGLLAKLGS